MVTYGESPVHTLHGQVILRSREAPDYEFDSTSLLRPDIVSDLVSAVASMYENGHDRHSSSEGDCRVDIKRVGSVALRSGHFGEVFMSRIRSPNVREDLLFWVYDPARRPDRSN